MSISLRCVLAGSESLLIQCGEVLAQHGHQVTAVVTDRPAIAGWASRQGAVVLPDASALMAASELLPFDYLFSITNLSILPDEVLALPTRGAVNFHDGPLPEYAGVNTPVWALLNGETAHGVTWHMMTSRVDAGDIVAQRRFALGDDETALTLNTKCFQAAIESFEELAGCLDRGAPSPIRHGQPPQRWFRRRDRPEAAGMICWGRDAAEIVALVRSLDHGKYANPVALAKASHGGRPIFVHEAAVLGARSGLGPGTIVAVDAQAVVVATGGSDIALRRFGSPDGSDMMPGEVAERFGLATGDRFDSLDATQAAQLSALNAAVAAHEAFWLRRLETQQPVELPYIDRSVQPAAPDRRHADLALPASLDATRAERVLAAAVGYVARLTDKGCFDIGYCDEILAAQFDGFAPWFAPQVPLRADVAFGDGLEALNSAIAAELRELHRRIGFAVDLIARTPSLRAAAGHRDPAVLPVAVLIVDRIDEASALPGAELTIAISAKGDASRWVYDRAKIDRRDIERMQRGFATFLDAADRDPGLPLAELPLLDAAEREDVLLCWNDSAVPARDACVHQLIAEQASRTPEGIAVTCGGISLTYHELDRRAGSVAKIGGSQR